MTTCPECKQPYASWVNTATRRQVHGLACCLACRATYVVPGGGASLGQ